MGISSGLILLKMCDPKQQLPVMESFALKNFAAMPLIFTFLPQCLLIVQKLGIYWYTTICAAGLSVFFTIWYIIYRPMLAKMELEDPDDKTLELADVKEKNEPPQIAEF